MQTCARCQAPFDAPPGAPCPRCGTPTDLTVRSPRASTTERPPLDVATLPSAPPGLPAPVPSAPYPSTAPMQPSPYAPPPSYTPSYANQATMQPHSLPQAAYAPQPSPYAYAPQPMQPIQVVVQNQIQAPPVMYPTPYGMPAPAYPMAPYVRRKDPGVAVLCSFFLPGGGQLYNGQIGKGLAFIVATIVNFFLLFVGIGFLTGLATWIWGMIDAHGTAERINRGEQP